PGPDTWRYLSDAHTTPLRLTGSRIACIRAASPEGNTRSGSIQEPCLGRFPDKECLRRRTRPRCRGKATGQISYLPLRLLPCTWPRLRGDSKSLKADC